MARRQKAAAAFDKSSAATDDFQVSQILELDRVGLLLPGNAQVRLNSGSDYLHDKVRLDRPLEPFLRLAKDISAFLSHAVMEMIKFNRDQAAYSVYLLGRDPSPGEEMDAMLAGPSPAMRKAEFLTILLTRIQGYVQEPYPAGGELVTLA